MVYDHSKYFSYIVRTPSYEPANEWLILSPDRPLDGNTYEGYVYPLTKAEAIRFATEFTKNNPNAPVRVEAWSMTPPLVGRAISQVKEYWRTRGNRQEKSR